MSGCPSVYQIAFSALRGISIESANEILSAIGSEEEFFRMSARSLREYSGADSRIFDDAYRAGLLESARRECHFRRLPMLRCFCMLLVIAI